MRVFLPALSRFMLDTGRNICCFGGQTVTAPYFSSHMKHEMRKRRAFLQ